MIYLKRLCLPSDDEEFAFFLHEKRTCFHGVYPFKLFPQKGRTDFQFGDVTIFCGGNGSGKTTILNVIAEKIQAVRHSEFNSSAFFGPYVSYCSVEGKIPRESQFLSSDDVFDYILNVRYLNEGIDHFREELFSDYAAIRKRASEDEDYRRLHGLEDYDRWKEVCAATSRKKSQSRFVRERLAKNIDMRSNGETAMRYFTQQIDRDALYLLDEPENSLSVQYQIELAKFIRDSVRFFNCQFILSTHSPIFLSLRDALIYDLDSLPVRTCRWTELENVRAYFDFFQAHREEFESLM